MARRANPEQAVQFLGPDLTKEVLRPYNLPERADQIKTFVLAQLLDQDWNVEEAADFVDGIYVYDPELGPVAWSGVARVAPKPMELSCIEAHYMDDVVENGQTLEPQMLASALAQSYEWVGGYVYYHVVTQNGEIVEREGIYIAPN